MQAAYQREEDRADRAEVERDELLAALQRVERWMSGYGTKTQSEMRQDARAAIAKHQITATPTKPGQGACNGRNCAFVKDTSEPGNPHATICTVCGNKLPF